MTEWIESDQNKMKKALQRHRERINGGGSALPAPPRVPKSVLGGSATTARPVETGSAGGLVNSEAVESGALPVTAFRAVPPAQVGVADTTLDNFISGLDILDAYRRCGGQTNVTGCGALPEVVVRCPSVFHEDKNPSASINTSKSIWKCFSCGMGGDVIDMFAAAWNVPDYKKGKNFPELKRRIAAEYGWTVTGQNGFAVAVPPGTVTALVPEPKQINSGNLVLLPGGADLEEDSENSESNFDWHQYCGKDTFLNEYMKSCTIDFAPEEFHFWNALQLIGLAIGRNIHVSDSYPIYPNLFLCLVGNTGVGKSSSQIPQKLVIDRSLPYLNTDTNRTGISIIDGISSGPALINEFIGSCPDIGNGKPGNIGKVKGLVLFRELSELIAKSSQKGNTIRELLIDMHDCPSVISNRTVGRGREIATEPFCAFTATTQDDSISTLVSHGDISSGFMNRFIVVYGKRKPKPEFVSSTGAVDITAAAELLRNIHYWSKNNSGKLDWEPDAKKLADEWHVSVMEKLLAQEDSDMIVRLADVMKKLVIIFCANNSESKVTVDIMKSVIELSKRLIDSYGITETHIGSTRQVKVEQRIKTALIKAKRNVDPSKLHINRSRITSDMMKGGKGYTREEINKAVEQLLKSGEIVKVYGPNGGEALMIP